MSWQPSLFDEPPKLAPFVRGSDTSQAAAESLCEQRKATQRGKLLRALKDAGVEGLSDPEMQAVTGLSGDTQRPRIRELEAMGAVVRTNLMRRTTTGRFAHIVVVSECWSIGMGRHETDHRRGKKR